MTFLSIHNFGSLLVYLVAIYGTVCGLVFSGEREHRSNFSGFFSMFWKVHGIFYVSFLGHSGFVPLPSGAE